MDYYSNNAYTGEDFTAIPVNEAAVTLFTWDPEETAWEEVDLGEGNNPVYTNNLGYYHFDDVSGVGVVWFKIKSNAGGKTPPGHPEFNIQERVARNQVRPVGIPDAGIIRVDVIHAGTAQLFLEEPAAPWYRGFLGHFVRFFEDGSNKMEDMGNQIDWPPPHDGTCPPGENGLHFKGCIGGHWYSWSTYHPWDYWTVAGWAHYVFREPVAEPPGEEWGDGYFWWDPAQPYWALHMGMDTDIPDKYVKAIIDFIDTPLPE